MRLTAEEEQILAGRWGEPARRALQMQVAVGDFFGAEWMVPVTSAHLTGDPESMGDAGFAFVEDLVRQGARFVVPTTTNSCNVDFDLYREFGQSEEVAQKERRLRELISAMGGILLTSCTNHQAIYQPRFGEHPAWGDTGTVIYANAVCGARSNFEGGPASYAAALTGRVRAYGMHLPDCRRGTHLVEVRDQPRGVSDGERSGSSSAAGSPTTGSSPSSPGSRPNGTLTGSSSSGRRWPPTALSPCSTSSG